MSDLRDMARAVRRAFRRPLEALLPHQSLFRGRCGLEIGGPSELFRRVLPVYEVASRVDGVNFSTETVWEGRLAAGDTYRYFGRRTGRQFICEATDLADIPDDAYDFVLSSNSLEHIANPLRAMAEWLRVLKPGGVVLLVLPRKESNFDRDRDVTAMSHLVDDYERAVTEHDLTHMPEILERHVYALDPPAVDRAFMARRSLANFENRCLHHHVFDPALIREVFRFFDLTELVQMSTTIDHIALARLEPATPKPAPRAG